MGSDLRTTRRGVLLGALGAATGCATSADPAAPRPLARLDDLERELGGRIGVAAIDTGTGLRLGHRASERFAMCSTFKAPLVGHVLARVERGELAFDKTLPFAEADVLGHAPVAKARLAEGVMTVEIACAAAVEVSDNTAANLLLREVGGPAGFTAFLRSMGDSATRLDRDEPTLNTNVPGDPRDTTTPEAMSETIRAMVLGDVLKPDSRRRLLEWMEASTTGRKRLRAGLPPSWRGGDKTGTGENGACNDVAVAWGPGRAPLVIASYVHAPDATDDARTDVHAEIARFVVGAMR